jgi:tetratricopeptide (TPR) repeat protein
LSHDDLLGWHRHEAEACARDEAWSAAAFHWDRLLKARPDEAVAWKGRGLAHSHLGLPARALADLRKATRLNPVDPEAWLASGRALAELGRHAEAVADYTTALKVGAADPHIYCDRGDALAHLERWREAASDFARAIEGGLNVPPVWHCRALACLAAGDEPGYHAACAWFVGRFDAKPSPARARQAVWVCCLAPGKGAFYSALAARARAIKMSKEEALNTFHSVTQMVRDLKFDVKDGAVRLGGEPTVGGTAYSPATANAAMQYRMDRFDLALVILTGEPGKLTAHLLNLLGKKDGRDLPDVTRADFGLNGSPWNNLFLAMTYQQLGEGEKARQTLGKAVRRMEAEQGRLRWNERLELRLLRREAEALIGQMKKP